MRTDKMAADFLQRVKARLTDAGAALKRGDYPDVVRYSQECVELSTKACLRVIGVDYPKVHDVGDILEYYRDSFPEWLRKEISQMREISRDLFQKRGPSVYGIEREGKTASELFTKTDAEEALQNAEKVYSTSQKFFKEYYYKKP
ncbi:MAG: HEPN domain-containing protein [Candidatus Jordarchaeum sp.]|uniref:HEPN domain-containing protein n=1 Tax=Candidatus Jordarchaeum sp. TaxID=2823881 RepID=UPI0040495381